jgi:hypothetical protein
VTLGFPFDVLVDGLAGNQDRRTASAGEPLQLTGLAQLAHKASASVQQGRDL